MLNALFVFVATFTLDFVWAKYTRAVAGGERLKSSICAAGIIVLTGSATIGYVDDHWMLIPAMAGCFAGTFASMSFLTTPAPEKKSDIEDIVFRMLCTRRHLCRRNGPCNGLPRDPLFSPEDAEAYNSHL